MQYVNGIAVTNETRAQVIEAERHRINAERVADQDHTPILIAVLSVLGLVAAEVFAC